MMGSPFTTQATGSMVSLVSQLLPGAPSQSNDFSRLRLKTKDSIDSLRQKISSSFRPHSSGSTPRRRATVSIRPQTAPTSSLLEHYPYQNKSEIMLHSSAHRMPNKIVKRNPRLLSPLPQDAPPDHVPSAGSSLYGEADFEPLIDDDYIPTSAKPLIKTQEQRAQRRRSPSPQRSSKVDSNYEPPKTPDTPHHRIDSVLAVNDESSHYRRKSIVDSITTSSLTNSPREVASVNSAISTETATSVHGWGLAPLQASSVLDETEKLDPVLEDDPASYDLVSPPSMDSRKQFSIEERMEEMFSKEHLQEIFSDPSSMLKFTTFLTHHRPQSIPLLIYYLDALKSIKAVQYANAIAESLTPIDDMAFTRTNVSKTANESLETRAQQAFDALLREDLPAFIAQVFIKVVDASVRQRVTCSLPDHLRDASEGLAEVFCLTDPSRQDNPIVFASEEFHKTTQYGVEYAIGRNCRFLQGPNTSRDSIRRLKEATSAGKEACEIFLNYRRDGSPFMNLLMVAPLTDSRGVTRYFIGAQVDVTGLCKDATDLEGLRRIISKKQKSTKDDADDDTEPMTIIPSLPSSDDEFQELSEMFNDAEIDIVRKHGGRMHPHTIEDEYISHQSLTNLPIHTRDFTRDPSRTVIAADEDNSPSFYPSPTRGRLLSVYQNYLLLRPAPSLRILFASPALRTPGMLQSPFLSRIGGSARVRDELAAALTAGRGVTAKVRWLLSGRAAQDSSPGRPRWVHCTPLLGKGGAIGVWMVILVDEEEGAGSSERQRGGRFKLAPPVGGRMVRPESTMSLRSSNQNTSRRSSMGGSLVIEE
ncbi:hypothetical protein BT63DRAFT_459184 [Microthyrium microscopicum]|uniref:PAC domain-containing protein n=1 Tax=Microthyrium microscopicum TaxID=703497 RepID=A0A6A6U0I1_9PEZI|nr:hypothetical protein BT63DRAFT_459184 [Microthyrium microscopicum]